MSKYQITKEKCQSMINGVCSGCGGKIEPIETVDNAGNPTFWAGCPKCEKFCWGVDKKIFRIARKMVQAFRFEPYSHMRELEYKTREEKRYWLTSQTRGASNIVQKILGLARLEGLLK